ncbi:SusC/RagA family TonB-linked outer membrane protein [uncultured Aquimarina sp.]|uniref:SusC/RagA family TonB-linked outer membrane protein n=1 Tax=uncultured Aquimarina sp. TaxID=575652 RepID=UPI0026293B6B|nr:SusC/RagA family TonB-linked outer membrane protein [uncultured Aquimarina sp.]
MRTKFRGILTLLLAFVVQLTFAQEKTISGNVTDNSGLPLPGVNIVVKGTSKGTQSDFDGNYTIEVNRGAVLSFSYLGFTTKEVAVGDGDSINIQLAEDAATLEEVVVTAQGIRREKKSLGYAVTVVQSDEIEQKPESDINRALNGKIPGVQITGAGGATGSATNVFIRTSVSITGNNQPLYIVDGVPFESSPNTTGGFTSGTTSTSNRTLDLNPDNIANISVLKGLSAANLYGSRGRNGVILITTKAGSTEKSNKKFEVSFSNTTYITQISNLPEFQNTYGQGADQAFNPGFVGNWGAAFSDIDNVIHPYANGRNPGFDQLFPQFFGIEIPYQAAENNVKDFFRTGLGRSTSVGVSSASEKGNFSINYNNTDEDGYIESNNLRKNSFSIGGNLKLSNNFNVGGTLNYVNTTLRTPPISASNGIGALTIFQRLLFIPRNIDLTNLPFQNPVDGSSVYYRPDIENPYWLLDNAGTSSDTRRTYGSFNAGYTFNDHISLQYTFGLDTYTDLQRFSVNKGAVARAEYQVGYLRTTTSTNEILNHRAILNFDGYRAGNFRFGALVGFESRRDEFGRDGIASTNQVVFGRQNHDNYINHNSLDPVSGVDLQFNDERNVVGFFGEVKVDYNDYLYATISGRNDWVSNVQPANRSIFYPSTSISFIPTSAFEGLRGDVLNFLKIRGGYATSAGFPTLFRTAQQLNSVANAFGPSTNPTTTNTFSGFLANPDLKPELHREIELGIEANFFNSRITLDASVYSRVSKDQILQRNLAPSTGFSQQFFNAGQIDGEGIEIALGLTPVKTDSFSWNIQNNFTAAETEVVEIPEERILTSGFGGLGNYAIEGLPLGVIVGTYYIRDDNGNILVDATNTTTQGRYLTSNDVPVEDNLAVIGDPNPDWRMTTINTFSYKGLSLSAQLEYTHGGDILSNTASNLLTRGVTRDTEDRESTTILPGVVGNPTTGLPVLDANGQPIQNTVQIGANDIYFQNVFRANEGQVFDGSTLRLRDVTLAYKLSEEMLAKTPFGSISFAISGQNIWYKAYNFPEYLNFDPEVLSTGVGNGQGLDFQTAPTSKRYSFSIKATF